MIATNCFTASNSIIVFLTEFHYSLSCTLKNRFQNNGVFKDLRYRETFNNAIFTDKKQFFALQKYLDPLITPVNC